MKLYQHLPAAQVLFNFCHRVYELMSQNTPNSPKPSVQFVTAKESDFGQRIDNFLIKHLKGVPKSHFYRILRKGEVRVNKKRVKADYRIQEGDIIRIPPIRVAEPESPRELSVSHSLEKLLKKSILFENDGLLVLNKPSGLAVHGGSGINLGLIEALRIMYAQESLELVHRLDRETSGCILIAKKPSVLKELHALLRDGQVEKCYLALVKGQWPKHLHLIDEPLKKFELRSGERMVSVNEEGKPSQTEFRVIKRFADTTLVEAKPKTGRTHQIRVHAHHAGHAIIGDDKYGDDAINKKYRQQGCKRLFLHASALNFVLPRSQEKITVTADLDKDMQVFLDKLQ